MTLVAKSILGLGLSAAWTPPQNSIQTVLSVSVSVSVSVSLYYVMLKGDFNARNKSNLNISSRVALRPSTVSTDLCGNEELEFVCVHTKQNQKRNSVQPFKHA